MDLKDTIAKLLETGASQSRVIHQPGYTPAVITPEGYTLKPLEIATPLPAAPPPEFITAYATLGTPEAFGAYVQRFKGDGTIVFWRAPKYEGSEWKVGGYVASLDYHEPSAAARCSHSALFTPAFTPEAVAWLGINGKATEQLTLMRFIDEHMPEIVNPDGATLYEVARTLEIASHGRFASRIDRTTEGRSLTWTEETTPSAGTASQKIPVPDSLEIEIPVFRGVPTAQPFVGRLIYEVKNGALHITVRLLRVHEPILAAAEELHAAVKAAVGDVTMIEGEA